MADQKSNLSENRFWLQILGDYARFIRDALSIKEAHEVLEAQKYIALLDDLLGQANRSPDESDLESLNRQVTDATQEFRKYILSIIRRQISEEVFIDMTPAYLNHMVNDTEMCLDLLHEYIDGGGPVRNPVTISLNWLLNIYEGTLSIQDKLGIVFFSSRQQAGNFADEFLNLYYEAWVLNGLRRCGLNQFPSITQMNTQIRDAMTRFGEYLVNLITLMEQKKILGSLTLLNLDNMYRSVCYFLTKLAQADGVSPPVCNPASPRMEIEAGSGKAAT